MFCIIEFNIIRLLVNYMLIILFFVNHDMLLKIVSLTKHLATYLAYIWFITSVMSLFSIYAVSLNIPLLTKQNSYYLTKQKIAKSTWEIAKSTWEIYMTSEKSHCPREKSLSTLKNREVQREISLLWKVVNLTIMKSGKSHYEKW